MSWVEVYRLLWYEIMINKIRTIFWTHKVLELDGLEGILKNGKSFEEKLKKSLDGRYRDADPSFENQDMFDAVMKSFFDKASWKKYLSGESIPKYSEDGKFFTNPEADQKHPYIVNIVEELFPEIKGLFKRGPYGLISVLECNNAEDALEQYELSFDKFVKATGYTKKAFHVNSVGPNVEDVEHIDYVITWDDTKARMSKEPYNYVNILNKFLPDIEVEQIWNKENEFSLFLHVISGYVEARFLKTIPHIYSNIPGVDASRLASITIKDYEKGAESGILYFERQYGIDRKVWFDPTLFLSEQNVFEVARKNTLSVSKEVFPELDSFVF
ncbi:hypothetical protein ITG08_06640 [Vibrio cyclitrophicus]|nr:hypothetical protein [Vibrio cyclitrophicus]OEE04201.1 hypothetical protein OC7_10150 [Vibrio cyclitrophicus ZF270]UPR26406.1 hypothetical protein ITG08_06640 [Vibrio cyclitrophicus]